jgi:hypothetical protein
MQLSDNYGRHMRIKTFTKHNLDIYCYQLRLLQKPEKGHFCHSELVEELRQIKQLEHPSTGSG